MRLNQFFTLHSLLMLLLMFLCVFVSKMHDDDGMMANCRFVQEDLCLLGLRRVAHFSILMSFLHHHAYHKINDTTGVYQSCTCSHSDYYYVKQIFPNRAYHMSYFLYIDIVSIKKRKVI